MFSAIRSLLQSLKSKQEQEFEYVIATGGARSPARNQKANSGSGQNVISKTRVSSGSAAESKKRWFAGETDLEERQKAIRDSVLRRS